MNLGRPIPQGDATDFYSVNVRGQREIVWGSLYDYIAYAQAGQTSLTFYQNPIGQSSKTRADTNMTLAGQLPKPQDFITVAVEIDFYPGNAIARAGVDTDALLVSNLNDCNLIAKSGWLEVKVGEKRQVQDGPLGKFPPVHRLSGISAISDTTTAAATGGAIADYGCFSGQLYTVVPFDIAHGQNFEAVMYWPTAVAISVAGRIGVNQWGYLYRAIQ